MVKKAPAAKPAAPQATNGRKPLPDKAPKQQSFPASLVQAIPNAAAIMANVQDMEAAIPAVIKSLEKSRKAGAIPCSRAFVVLKRMVERMEESLKLYTAVRDAYKNEYIPALFEQEGIPNVNLDEGFRVGVSSRLLASIIPDKKAEAYQWLRDNKLGDIIGETVNASTLSATAKSLMEEKNMELPEALFRVAHVPNTSVTKIGK